MRSRKNIFAAIVVLVIIAIALVIYAYHLRNDLFDDNYATVIFDRDHELLGARIADDGQWRFPAVDSLPEKYEKCLLTYEDEYFYYHPGFNPFSLLRAMKHNISAGSIVSGGSTITMQLLRLAGGNAKRTYPRKILEIFQSVLIELVCTKKEILCLYASHAPFGGNVVGLNAASWRYFMRDKYNLSWAEYALLAVLPNNPSMIHPGRNRDALKAKRDRLLYKLWQNEEIDSVSCQLSVMEPIPEKPETLPALCPHLLERVNRSDHGQQLITTIDKKLQAQVYSIVEDELEQLSANKIYNMAVLVADVSTGDVLSYIGNSSPQVNLQHDNYVDVAIAPRSPGSALKPILYALMLEDGLILPNMLVSDVPTFFAGYSPRNFNNTYDGAVPASKALSRSLNIPAVLMLKEYDYHRFAHALNFLGFSSINKPADHYGLSLILGGAEVTLWELTGVYAYLSRILKNFYSNSGKYNLNDKKGLNFKKAESLSSENQFSEYSPMISAASVYLTYEALLEVNRPEEEQNFELFRSSQEIAWKTGTSFGYKDAWAVGTTKNYVVGVWVGNADGEGRPGIIGVEAAAPVMFEIFRQLPYSEWFDPPYDELYAVSVCSESGHRAGKNCSDTDSTYAPEAGLRTPVCPYHILIHLDTSGKYRVNAECENVHNMVHSPWFVLPPLIEFFYKDKNPFYKMLPPFRNDCLENATENNIEFIYPDDFSRIFLPVDIDGNPEAVIFEAAHRSPQTKIFWHLDDTYILKSVRS